MKNSFSSSRFGVLWQGFTTNGTNSVNNDSLLRRPLNILTMAIFSDLRHVDWLVNRGGILRFSRKPFVWDAVCSNDVAGYRDGDLLLVLFMLLGFNFWARSLLFSHITFSLPFVVVTVYSRPERRDVRMLEAAKDTGASEVTIYAKSFCRWRCWRQADLLSFALSWTM